MTFRKMEKKVGLFIVRDENSRMHHIIPAFFFATFSMSCLRRAYVIFSTFALGLLKDPRQMKCAWCGKVKGTECILSFLFYICFGLFKCC